MDTIPQDDTSRPDATEHDVSRQVATSDDGYISLDEARLLFEESGREITGRTLQRSCKNNHLDCKKVATDTGEKWFALTSSVHRRIAELEAFDRLREARRAATRPDVSGHVGEERPSENKSDEQRPVATADMSEPVATSQESHTTEIDTSRRVETERDVSPGLSERERELYEARIAELSERVHDLRADKDTLTGDKEKLYAQLATKDVQIDRFFSSERDTKTLFGSLQTLIASIMPGSSKSSGDKYVPMRDALDSGLGDQPKH